MSKRKRANEPFLPTFGNKADPLIGRSAILDDISQGLRSSPGYPTRASLIIGQRGTGKTALLLEIAEQAEELGYVVAQAAANESMNEDILQAIQMKGEQFIAESKRKITGISAGALGFSFGLTFNEETKKNYGFRIKLELLCEKMSSVDKGILMLIDEVQASNEGMRELATAYQYLVGKGMNIAITMAGLPHSISSVLNDDVLTFLNRAYKIELQPLPLTEVRRYYSKALSDLGKTLSLDLADTLAQASDGYPYLFQLIGFNLVRNMESETVVTQEIAQHSIEESRAELISSVYLPALKPLSDTDMSFLFSMTKDEGPSATADIQKRLNVDNSYFQQYRARLIETGVIASPRRGELEFTIPYLKDYLRTLL